VGAPGHFAGKPSSHIHALKYSPDQPRVPYGNPDGGQWAAAGESRETRTAGHGPASHVRHTLEDAKDPTFIRKQKFVDAHLAAAEKGAEALDVPAAYLLALSELESTWGTSRFATQGNNFFDCNILLLLKQVICKH